MMTKTVSWEEANKNIDPKVIAEAEELAAQDLLQMGTKMTDPKRNMYGEFMEGVVSLKDERIAELEAQLKTAKRDGARLFMGEFMKFCRLKYRLDIKHLWDEWLSRPDNPLKGEE